jgi:hypothetical protein
LEYGDPDLEGEQDCGLRKVMNCDSCHELLSDHLDGALGRDVQMEVTSHLSDCSVCTSVHDELSNIVSCGAEYRDLLLETPPNPHALWLRISNIIESELPAPASLATAGAKQAQTGWLARTWRFTLPQLAGAAAMLVIGVAALTTLGVREFSLGRNGADQAGVPSRAGKSQDQIREQQIAYWDQRVEEHKAQWNQQTRDAFERNNHALDQAVADYRHQLQVNPDDEVSAEMLNSALNDKLALLKDFAE